MRKYVLAAKPHLTKCKCIKKIGILFIIITYIIYICKLKNVSLFILPITIRPISLKRDG